MAKKVNIEITNPVGLYASPATELVDAVKLYKSHVTLNYNEKSVNIRTIDKSNYRFFEIPSTKLIKFLKADYNILMTTQDYD